MSLGDFRDNQVPDGWRTEALNTIRQCRNLDWLILTKRPQNILVRLGPYGWSHVWLGATVENRTEARRRILEGEDRTDTGNRHRRRTPRHRRRTHRAIALAGFVAVVAPGSRALADRYYVGPNSGNWNNSANWSAASSC